MLGGVTEWSFTEVDAAAEDSVFRLLVVVDEPEQLAKIAMAGIASSRRVIAGQFNLKSALVIS